MLGCSEDQTRSWWDTAEHYAVPVAAAVATGMLAAVAALAAVGVIGFTSTGIAAGSWAASWMSASAIASGGRVTAWSGVAIFQSVGVVRLRARTVGVTIEHFSNDGETKGD